jgi:large subunit ribosomal protein L10
MPKTREQKEEIVKRISNAVKGSPSTVFVIQDKLPVKEATDLRQDLWKEGVELFAVKKTLLALALKEAGMAEVPVDAWDRTVAVAFGKEDAIAPARLLHTFSKTHEEQIQLVGGILEGQYMDAAQVKELAVLPSREELLAKTVYLLGAPMTGLARVLNGPVSGLVQSLKAISEKK